MHWLFLIVDTTNSAIFDKPSVGTTILNTVLFAAVPVAVIMGLVLLIRSLRKRP